MLRRLWGYTWAAPITAFGLLFALLALWGGSVRAVDGIIEMQGGLLDRLFRLRLPLFGSGAALTLGHVILARNQACLERSRAHERTHVKQFEQWGVFLLPAYMLAGQWARLRGLDPYLHNPFEQQAYRESER